MAKVWKVIMKWPKRQKAENNFLLSALSYAWKNYLPYLLESDLVLFTSNHHSDSYI